METTNEFQEWPKIPRFNTLTVTITEKIDGANSQLLIPADPEAPILAGSRSRWVTPGKTSDNFGFAAWVLENSDALRRLGPGRHYGEWWGAGIQRRYGLEHKRFSLFNADRWTRNPLPEGLPSNVGVVPVLYQGPCDSAVITEVVAALYRNGSVACPGWAKPEGVVIAIAGKLWKVTDLSPGAKAAPPADDIIHRAPGAVSYCDGI